MADLEKPAASMQGAAAVCVLAIVAGAIIGFVGGAFRWCLQSAELWRAELSDWAHRLAGPGWLVPMVAAAAGATLAALIVRWQPLAAGSGIPHVEAVHRGDAPPPSLRLLPAKFVGGVLAIGSGLVLGREGPTVHMGAAIGAEAARRARLSDSDVRMLQTAVGGAGLAVAFNAPLGGLIFTVEEVTKTVRLRTVLATLFATAVGVGCSRLVTGNHPDFTVEALPSPALAWLPLFLVFGLLTGCLGVLYNRLVLGFLDHVGMLPRIPAVAKAAVIGALIGLVMFVDPLATGGGDTLTQLVLSGNVLPLSVIAGLLLLRFVAGPLSYASVVPGGLFAPLLALGALWGVLFVGGFNAVWPGDHTFLAVPMALVGMAALFGAAVRAPVTGIVIVIEMTATTSVALAMLIATAAAVLVAELVNAPPIYDSLGARMHGQPTTAGPTTVPHEQEMTHMPDANPIDEMNRQVISEFRETGGKAGGMFEGKPLVLVHHVGAKSGVERIAPLVPYLDGDRIYIFASKAGADTNPDWYHNLVANPDAVVEFGTETFPATARLLSGAERDDVYAKQTEAEPQFAEYQRKTTRLIPVFELQRTRTP